MSTVQALIQTDWLRLDGELAIPLCSLALASTVLLFLYSILEEDTGIPLVRDTGKSRFSLSKFIAYFFNANKVLREAYDTVSHPSRSNSNLTL